LPLDSARCPLSESSGVEIHYADPLGSARLSVESESSGVEIHFYQTTQQNVVPKPQYFSVSLTPRNFLYPLFANRDGEKNVELIIDDLNPFLLIQGT